MPVSCAPVKKPTVEERRNEILEVTCEVVIERGFAATRIADVAKRLGVSSSLIHYHFDSKEQLLAEAFAHYARKDLAEMVGTYRETATQVLNDLKNDGLIDIGRKRIIILDPEGLEARAESV